ncbi:hypothetical protein ACE3MQ_26960 [Paenibacillus lentus]|uniref:hypothetical protein n=1 Tax=Paenibacillus lentus TaxID=1338368 RepID=UPI00366274DC
MSEQLRHHRTDRRNYNSCQNNELINGILKKAHELHYQVLLLPSYYENDIESNHLTLLKKKMIDGILLTSHTLHPEQILALSEWGKIVCCEACPIEFVPSVFPDRFVAYIEVFTYLKNKDYKRIHFTSGRDFQSSPSTRLRIQAYQETITEAYEGQSHGYNYPEDFEIIGEENTPLSEILGFPSVDYHQTAIGEQAVSLLLSDKYARIQIRHQLNFRAQTEAVRCPE